MADEKLKYFDLLQGAISRMAGNSFLLKGWSVTLSSAILGLSTKDGRPALALVALVPVVAFWGLDAYYLALERRFRDLWRVAVKNPVPDFMMSPGAVSPGNWFEAARRPAVLGLHLPLGLAAIFVYLILAKLL